MTHLTSCYVHPGTHGVEKLCALHLLTEDPVKSVAEAKKILQKKLTGGNAPGKFDGMMTAQGGDAPVGERANRFPAARRMKAIAAAVSVAFMQGID